MANAAKLLLNCSSIAAKLQRVNLLVIVEEAAEMTSRDCPSRPQRTETAYDEQFFDRLTDDSLQSARVVVPLIQELVAAKKVVDIGCGRGAWLRVFLEHGATEVMGYDGEYVEASKLLIDRSLFATVDLNKPFSVPGSFDLAVCLEVGEHLPARAARGLVANLTSVAPLVLFSAAIPNQGGTHHINEQWPSYWQNLFSQRRYRKLDPFRRFIFQDPRVASHYRQNLLLYAAEAVVEDSPAYQAEARLRDQAEMEIIHEYILSRYQSVRGLVAELPKAIWRALKNRLVQ
jgi:SAM-dependent methyltransferase